MKIGLLAQIHAYDEFEMDYEFCIPAFDEVLAFKQLAGIRPSPPEPQPIQVNLPKGVTIDLSKVRPKRYLFSYHLEGYSNYWGKKIKFFERSKHPITLKKYIQEIAENVSL